MNDGSDHGPDHGSDDPVGHHGQKRNSRNSDI